MMQEITYKTTNKICRLCLKSCENSIPIFDESNVIIEKTFRECIEDLGRIALSPLDNLPETACQQCYKLISDTYSFVLRIRKNDGFLHNILQCELIEEDYTDSNSKTNSEEPPIEGIEEQQPFNKDDSTPEQPVPIVVDKDDINFISEEGELPQYIEIAYVQPSAELVPITFTSPDQVALSDNAMSNFVQCSYCPKIFAKLKYKREHERYHLEDGRKCPHCERKFIKRCDWTRHVNTHTLERTFSCSACSKVFVTQAELNRHEKVHNNVREHKCEHCTNEFKDIGALKFHIRTVHLKERPYFCQNCGKAFSTASRVRRHQKSKICSESKMATTIHQDGKEEFIIFENTFQESYHQAVVHIEHNWQEKELNETLEDMIKKE